MIGTVQVVRHPEHAETIALRDEWGTTIVMLDARIEILGRSGRTVMLPIDWGSPFVYFWYRRESGRLAFCGSEDAELYSIDLNEEEPALKLLATLQRSPFGALRELKFTHDRSRPLDVGSRFEGRSVWPELKKICGPPKPALASSTCSTKS